MSRKSKGEKGDKGEQGIQGEPGTIGLFVGITDCKERHERLELALFGKDGRGGIAADLQAIKTSTNIFRTVLLPVILSIASAAFIAFLLTR
jgi:hypothetical protein